MADKEPWFPGFEGDDQPKKERPKPAAPAFAPAPPAAPAPAAAAAPAPAPSRPVAAKPAPPPPPPAPPGSLPADNDGDVKPGSRKDLWKCPHCGAGNKPERDTCRSCGKSKTAPVIVLWHQQPLVRIGLGVAVVLIAVLAFWLTRPDLSLHQPVLKAVDAKPRLGSSAARELVIKGSFSLAVENSFSVCGRVAALGAGPGGTQLVALALGPAAKEEQPEVTTSGSGFTISGGIVIACTGEALPKLAEGQLVSLKGQSGKLMKEGRFAKEGDGLLVVLVEQALTGE